MALPEDKRRLDDVPDAPGVYLWKAADGTVLYVGKAKSLRKRMRQYLSGHDERERVPLLMEQAADYAYVVTKNEVEGLILENSLIKQFDPPFNVRYRDDKSFPFIALTMSDPFPAIKYTRERHREGTRYFGPYTDAKAARETIEVVRRIYPICRATCVQWKRVTARGGEPVGTPCFDSHVGKGPGVCIGAISRDAYAERVRAVAAFLEGKRTEVVRELEEQMREAAADLEYERAARLRNSLEAVRRVLERQKVVADRPLDVDVFGIERAETIAGVHVLLVREGRVLAGNEFVVDKGLDVPFGELVGGVLERYYAEAAHVPREVLVPEPPADAETVADWLTGLRGSRVRVAVPQRGLKRELLGLAAENARFALARYKHRTRYDEERINRALLELESALGLPAPPLRIECYDVSTLHGKDSVGSMVVFAGGKPDKDGYRRFRIRQAADEANDVAMMREVLLRRFARASSGDERFATLPDLVIVDGGKPQLSAALSALQETGARVPVVALAKREEEVYVPGWDEPARLPDFSPGLMLLKLIRDEAHRFAIEHHRSVRAKRSAASALDAVPGVGPARRKALLKRFGSVKRIREAGVDEIAQVPGIGRATAQRILEALHAPRRDDSQASGNGEAAGILGKRRPASEGSPR
ncbi:MAG: excinuclease ABC subunit UvrC [Anaerosomatales bacterium]|nr:excinuclease ABC subunit UvrC [Anaerosomatales bacterium]